MLSSLFGQGLTPHGFCLLWEPGLLWLHAASDIATGIAYFAIPLALMSIVIPRRELRFGWMFWLFALFILACGTTHFMDVWVLWYPDYGIQGLIKAFTAVASVLTAILLIHILPTLAAVPTPSQFRQVAEKLSDETDRHERTVEQLRRTEEIFQLLVESVHDCAMFMVDPTGTVTSWNAGAQHIMQYTAAEIVGRSFECFYPEQDRVAGKPMRVLGSAMALGTFQEEGWRVRKDGTQFLAEVVINPVRDTNGVLIGFAKITRDIGPRKQAEKELELARTALAQSQKMEAVGHLTGGIAHDFNNMLAAILGSLELLELRKETLSANANRILRIIRHAAEKGAGLTQRLLAFSRKQALSPTITDINRLVTGMFELLRRTLGEAVSVQTVTADGLGPAFVDENQLESALLNLGVNARDAMPQGGTLTIETGNVYLDERYVRRHGNIPAGEYAFIAVSDTGTGMTPEVLEHAFEPFYTTKEVGRGTGLGLSQVYGFVRQSGGHVEIYSEVGLGTTVKMYFPRANAGDGIAGGDKSPLESAAPHGSETILIVDDDEDVRSYSANAAHYLGYAVLEANSAASAMEILEQQPDIGLMFTDVGLPGMNGCALAEAAKATRPALKVVFTSGYARAAIANLGLLEPNVRFLPKPFGIESLAKTLRAALDGA